MLSLVCYENMLSVRHPYDNPAVQAQVLLNVIHQSTTQMKLLYPVNNYDVPVLEVFKPPLSSNQFSVTLVQTFSRLVPIFQVKVQSVQVQSGFQ